MARLVPNGDLTKMDVDVLLAVPSPFTNDVDVDKIQQQFPYGNVRVRVTEGGLCCSSGIALLEQGDADGDDRAIVVVAAVTVSC